MKGLGKKQHRSHLPPVQRILNVKNSKYHPFLAPVFQLSHNYATFCRRAVGDSQDTSLGWAVLLGLHLAPRAGTQQSHHHLPECSADSWPTKKPLPAWQGEENTAHVAHAILLMQQMSKEQAAITEMKGEHRRGKSRSTTGTLCW